MKLLQDRIREEGRVLPGNIIKVDGFLNHRVDTALMSEIADEFAKYFDISNITLVLTAEASGIALATVCAQRYGVPMVFAKKRQYRGWPVSKRNLFLHLQKEGYPAGGSGLAEGR